MSRGRSSGSRRLDPAGHAARSASSPAPEVRSQPVGRARGWPQAASPNAAEHPGGERPRGAQALTFANFFSGRGCTVEGPAPPWKWTATARGWLGNFRKLWVGREFVKRA